MLKSVLKGRVEPAFMGANKSTHSSDLGMCFYGIDGCPTPFLRLKEPKNLEKVPTPQDAAWEWREVHVYKGVVI